MHFSERIKAMQTSPIRRLIPFADEAKAKGKKVFHLNIGQPDIKTPDEYFDAVRNFKVETIAYATSHPVRERLRGLARLLDRALSDRRVAAVSLAAAIMGLLVTTMAMPTAAMANPITDAVNEVLNGLGGAFGKIFLE